MTCRCGDVVEIETRCRIPIWRTFGQNQWHVISEPRITLQGAVTWRNQCHHRATLQRVRIPSAIFYFFLFLVQFRLWRAAAFVSGSAPIHLFRKLGYGFLFAYHSKCGRNLYHFRGKAKYWSKITFSSYSACIWRSCYGACMPAGILTYCLVSKITRTVW